VEVNKEGKKLGTKGKNRRKEKTDDKGDSGLLQ
jgi:hypothetical protein